MTKQTASLEHFAAGYVNVVKVLDLVDLWLLISRPLARISSSYACQAPE